MEQQEREAEVEAEVLRRRLYRPGASTEDLESYLEATPTETPAPTQERGRPTGTTAEGPPAAAISDDRPAPRQPPPSPRRRRWLFVVAGGIAAVVLAGSAVAVGALAPPPSTLPSAAAPTADAGWTSAPRDPGDSLVATAVIDGGRRPGATGRAVPSADQGYLYTIATGDTVPGIAGRFSLCTADVLVALPYGADPRKLQASQRLLLERRVATAPSASRGTC